MRVPRADVLQRLGHGRTFGSGWPGTAADRACCGQGDVVVTCRSGNPVLAWTSGGSLGEGRRDPMRYLDGRARILRFLLAAQQTKGASMRFRIAHGVVMVVALSAVVAGSSVPLVSLALPPATPTPAPVVTSPRGTSPASPRGTTPHHGDGCVQHRAWCCDQRRRQHQRRPRCRARRAKRAVDDHRRTRRHRCGRLAPRPGLPAVEHDRQVRGSAVR